MYFFSYYYFIINVFIYYLLITAASQRKYDVLLGGIKAAVTQGIQAYLSLTPAGCHLFPFGYS